MPYRFFLVAPWFGVVAGLLVAGVEPAALYSRWTATSLALTHLLVLGFMLQSMVGALFQFVPVAVGGNVWRPRVSAAIVQPLFIIAAICLIAGFLGAYKWFFHIAVTLFITGILFFACVVGWALVRTPASGNTVISLRMAIASLVITGILGSVLVIGLSSEVQWPLIEITRVHAAWGLGGWALLLLTGVSYYVVPMFQLTPPYPDWFGRWFMGALFVLLFVWSGQLIYAREEVLPWLEVFGWILISSYAVMTLNLQQRRRRKVFDATLWFFRGAMVFLLITAISSLIFMFVPELGAHPRASVWLGIAVLPGVFVSAINGMVYKIVPFINWLHLQKYSSATIRPPTMKDMISEKAMTGQLILHFLSLLLLFGMFLLPLLKIPAGIAFASSCAWLGWNLFSALKVYRNFIDRISVA